MNRDLNHKDASGKITVLRRFGDGQYCVCQGYCWYAGLFDNYFETDNYGEAVEYFASLTK